MTALFRHPRFRAGMRDMAATAPGIAAWGLMTGVAMVESGLNLVTVIAMGVLVFAGSSQLAALPLLAAGAPMSVVLATSLCVNLRFIVFSAHLRPYVVHQPIWRRIVSGYFMADLSYVVFIGQHPQPATESAAIAAQEAYWAGTSVVSWTSWVVPSLIGIALGNVVPLSWGLGFAGTLALLGITCAQIHTTGRVIAAAVAGTAAVAAFALPLKLNILVGIAAAVAVGVVLDRANDARLSRRIGRAPKR